MATTQLGNGLMVSNRHEDALSVQEANLSMKRRLGASEGNMLVAQTNLASTYSALGRQENAVRMLQDVYSGNLRLQGEENTNTIISAGNYAKTLVDLHRFQEAKVLLRKTIPVARRVLGENHDVPLGMRSMYAIALGLGTGATLEDLHEAATTLEDVERTSRRVLGGAHPTTVRIEGNLRYARAALRARETGDVSSIREAVEATPPTSKSQN
jgi:hypothetical protein